MDLRTKRISEVPALAQATEQTNMLVENGGAAGRVPFDSLAKESFKKAGGYVTPQMFGAKGDGVADDTAALQNAVNSGKPVLLLPGKYRITATIDMPEYASISGTGQSTILPQCATVFNLSGVKKYAGLGYGKNFFSGFEIKIESEDVITVFDFNDAIVKHCMCTTIENLRIDNDSPVIPDMYTVFHFHSNNGGMPYALVKDCYVRNNATTGGYVARVYNDAEYHGWVSSVHFNNIFSTGFKWHYFFASDDVNMINTHGGANKVTNCCAQCTNDSLGFVFWKNSGAVELTANQPWDWSSASSSGSTRNPGCPYVIGADYEYNANYEASTSNEGITVDNISVYDGETFVRNDYNRIDKMLRVGGKYPAKLIPKYMSINNAICVRLAKLNYVGSSSRIRFILTSAEGLNYVSIIPNKKKVYSSIPLGSLVISASADNKEFYLHHVNGAKFGTTMGVMSFPVTNSMTGFGPDGYAGSLDHEKTIDCIEKMDECMLDSVPEGLIRYTWVPAPTYIAGTDGKMYKVEVSTDAEGNTTLNATYSYSGDSEFV